MPLSAEQEWGFDPPDGEEWPPEVGLTARAIIRQQANPFYAALVDAARLIHEDPGGGDVRADHHRMEGKVELLTELVMLYTRHQLDPVELPGTPLADQRQRHSQEQKARAVVGELLLYVNPGTRRSV